ncbi:MAG TPA: hypothetical protein P5239_10210, partial [Victivallales bacterium]|nr:hypothetical protein [Victivallales bacterium]
MTVSQTDLISLTRDKQVFIWGAMIVGQGVCRSLERIGIKVEAFIDSSPSLQNKMALGYPIFPPDFAFEAVRLKKAIIIISSGHYDFEIEGICKDNGFSEGIDYILSRSFNCIDPSIDIVGHCNLRCISCPRGNEIIQPPKGYIDVVIYKNILEKLLKEIPLLGSIQLYAWGEPLLHPKLPEIITLTREKKVLCAISSNLNCSKNLENVIKAKPDWFKVSCSGWGKNYELTHTGGKWDIFITNLKRLVMLRSDFHPEMQIVVNYHLYKNNIDEDYSKMEELCNSLSLIFRPTP